VTGFFHELQRRKVYRVAVGYVIVAGGVIQLASAVFPAWELPAWTLRMVVVLLLVGFPIALVLGWAFDITAEGIETTPALPSAEAGAAGNAHRRRNLVLLLGLGLTIAILAGFFILPRVVARNVEKSVAVLPFENYSDEKANAYFADGIQDDILTALSRIHDLKVISRTSVMGYRNSSKNVREIGRALGAGAVLEGSVRSDGKRVRLNVQLINAENDEHIWANEYDRELNDVFAIQSDLAREIASALRAKLSPSEKERMSRPPTENGEAYLAFMQARDLQSAVDDMAKMKQAEQLYQRALQLDPNFALACAGYSWLQSWIYHTWDPSPARREQARALALHALDLQPDLPDGHLALGFSYYYGSNDFASALRELQIAQRGLPNTMEVFLVIGAIKRRQGDWNKSNASLEKAASLSPKDIWALQNLALNYEMQRDFTRADATVDRALKLNPKSVSSWQLKARLAVEGKGDFGAAGEAIAALAALPETEEQAGTLCTIRGSVLILQRKFSDAIEVLENTPDNSFPDAEMILASKYALLGSAHLGLQDREGARTAFLRARALLEKALSTRPDDPDAHVQLGNVLAFLGEREAALQEAETAVKLLPMSKDAFHGPDVLQGAAQIHALVGEKARALAAIRGLLARPGLLTRGLLKLDPTWDSLRDLPEFQQLLIMPAHSA
jgi:TolB-like protein/Tfp pilus assembly protein PilF